MLDLFFCWTPHEGEEQGTERWEHTTVSRLHRTRYFRCAYFIVDDPYDFQNLAILVLGVGNLS